VTGGNHVIADVMKNNGCGQQAMNPEIPFYDIVECSA
jgi:hypothetical protein